MTAPLPPHWLDVMPETRAEVMEYAEEFAKLAVREALERAERAKQQCAGVGDSRCNYLAHCGQVCNKCGRIHDGQRTEFVRAEAARAAPAQPAVERFRVTRWPLIGGGMSDWHVCQPYQLDHRNNEYAWATIERIEP